MISDSEEKLQGLNMLLNWRELLSDSVKDTCDC